MKYYVKDIYCKNFLSLHFNFLFAQLKNSTKRMNAIKYLCYKFRNRITDKILTIYRKKNKTKNVNPKNLQEISILKKQN